MLLPDDCDDCKPAYLQRRLDSVPFSTLLFSSIPFLLTWIAAVAIAQKKLYPALATDSERNAGSDGLPVYSKGSYKPALYRWNWRNWLRKPSTERLASVVFSTSIGLSTVLVELLLFEISNTLNPAARSLALSITLGALLILNILITPALEIHGFVKTVLVSSSESTSTRRPAERLRFLLEAALLISWLMIFWYIPQASVLREKIQARDLRHINGEIDFREACLERVGIIGISLMASLSGFAAVSSLWQTFGVRRRFVRDADLSRKAAGLAATEDMIATKQSRLRALQRRMSDEAATGSPNMISKFVTSLRGSPDTNELRGLQMEVAGLDTIRFSLSNSLSTLQHRHVEQERSRTAVGKFLNACSTLFAVYCAYRVVAASYSSLHRLWRPLSPITSSPSSAANDPINNILALITNHWDTNFDRAAWARQISFLLSGVMLLASFNAVHQTFRLFARFAPNLLMHAQTGLPLIIAQIAGTYVISSALLLRSNLPAEVSGVITEALGAPLDGRFVERWFESWFLVAVAFTTLGIFIGRKVGGSDDDLWDADDDDVRGAHGVGKLS